MFNFFSFDFRARFAREKSEKKGATINARLCKSPCCYIRTITVYGIKKETQPVCERERVSERVSDEVNGSDSCVAD